MEKDLTGKLCLITGSSSGLGLEASVHLARKGCTVGMIVRNPKKGELARANVIKRSGTSEDKVILLYCDHMDLSTVKNFGKEYSEKFNDRPIDMLILNAGIMAPPREISKDGFESQFQTNNLAHFILVSQLYTFVKKAQHGRIVSVSSGGHTLVSTIKLDDLNREKSYSKWFVYGETKLINLLFMYKMNRLLKEKGVNNVMVVGAHPGIAGTELTDDLWFGLGKLFSHALPSATTNSLTEVLAAVDGDAKPNEYYGPSYLGESFGPPKKGCKISKAGRNEKLQNDTWAKLEELSGVNLSSTL